MQTAHPLAPHATHSSAHAPARRQACTQRDANKHERARARMNLIAELRAGHLTAGIADFDVPFEWCNALLDVCRALPESGTVAV